MRTFDGEENRNNISELQQIGIESEKSGKVNQNNNFKLVSDAECIENDDNDEHFCIKYPMNMDKIKLNEVALQAERYGISDTQVAAICTALLCDMKLVTQDNKTMVIDRMKVM